MDGYIFQNDSRVDADIFLYRQEEMRFQKHPDTCGRGFSNCITALVESVLFVFASMSKSRDTYVED